MSDQLEALEAADKTLAFFVVPDVARAAAEDLTQVPDKVKAVCQILSGARPGCHPHNAVLEKWRSEGLPADMQGSNAAQTRVVTGAGVVRAIRLQLSTASDLKVSLRYTI
jgi:hypothetical protein